MRLRPFRSGLILALVLTLAPLSAAVGTKQQADVFMRKIGEIAKPNPPAIKPGMRRTPISEGELNSWFTFAAQPLLPKGLTDPQITIVGDGKVSAQAVVDLESMGKRRASGSVFDPLSLLGGRVPVLVTGVLHTRDGVGRFQVESAHVSGVPVPAFLLQELVSAYSRSETRPQGLRLDDPFTLPASIQQIEVGAGRAVVVQ